jgi:hypothetical protein
MAAGTDGRELGSEHSVFETFQETPAAIDQ